MSSVKTTFTGGIDYRKGLLPLQILGKGVTSSCPYHDHESIYRAMLHDEVTYPDPFSFEPERFMKDGKINADVRDPARAVFGFGRRYVCHSIELKCCVF